MRKDFNGQSGHVIDATVGLRGVPVMISGAGVFLMSRDTDLSKILTAEAADGLSWCQRHTGKSWDTVDFIVDFIRLDIQCGHIQADSGHIIDL